MAWSSFATGTNPPGIFLLNRAAVHDHVRVLDLAPTRLKYLSVPGCDAVKGKLLL